MLLPGFIGVVVRRGIDLMWMAQPPIQVSAAGEGEWDIAVGGRDAADMTEFSATDARDLPTRLKTAYDAG